jgi:hypothetical protein
VKKVCRRSGKVKFDSHERAMIRAANAMAQPGNRCEFLRAYVCEFCGKWHLTSQPFGRNQRQPQSGAPRGPDSATGAPAQIRSATGLAGA